MAFLRKIPENPIIMEHFKGGAGHIENYPILTPDEMYGKGLVCAFMKLQPGCEVGRHRHDGDCEVFFFLSGKGSYLLDGEMVPVEAGDVAFVDDGEEHFLRNDGDEVLEYLALVLYTAQK